ncbi:MAG: hypothetical protein JW996_07045, partial [Candidatus Cloacimonetes bacterium]|nr:hypothetical protein [Candidatus Cloacimonadota bacterium]
MRKFLICMIILASSLLSALQLERSEAYIEFEISSLSELNKLSRIISIDDISGNTVTANVNQKELDRFESLGYSYRLLPREHLTGDFMASELDYGEMRDWDSYPTYEIYTEMMYQFAQDHPDICTMTSLGTSVQGRELLIAKISDNPEMAENEPEFLYIGQLHGDELVTYMLLLRLIDYLLENYELDDRITDLINNTEIWINPLANPDGTYAGGNHTVNGAVRRNANNVDLNRNFPDMLDGDHPDGNDWQPETEILMELARNKNFVLSSNFHSGAEVVNYPWDRIQIRHADDDWWQ